MYGLKNIKTLRLGLILFSSAILLFGCLGRDNVEKAEQYQKQSQAYYERTVELYKNLIARGKDLDRLHYALGKLYYERGNFHEAIAEFKKTTHKDAGKFTAIAYYRLGNFTDALDVFNKNQPSDDEYRYYYGMTCERLNLFDQALSIYRQINQKEFLGEAAGRIQTIEKQSGNNTYIKDLNAGIGRVLSSSPGQQDYPQAGALILLCDEKIEVTADNTQVSSMHYLVKILNERGKENFSESSIDYDSTYEKVELEFARTIKPDGTVADVGSRHIRDVSKYMNFPLYSNVRVYIISFPEISEGASIEYKVKIYRNQLINKKDFVLSYPVQSAEPVLDARLEVDMPRSKSLNIKFLNTRYNDFGAQLKPQLQEKGERLIYRWQFKNIPQMLPESNMPTEVELNPTVIASTFSSWQDIYDWWWQLARDKIAAGPIIKKKVEELSRGQVNDEARARAIYNFCAQKIRYVAVEYGQAGYEPHKAADIFKNKYGDCKDQAILLVTMLREAGLSAWPVLIPTRECYNLNKDFPAVIFNHCIAVVFINNQYIFLDPTAETCSFGDLPLDDQDRDVLIIKEDGYLIQHIPFYPAEHNSLLQQLKIHINEDETITASRAVLSRGVYDQAQRYWMLYTPPELIKETLEERIQDISIGAKLQDYNIKNLQDLDNPLVLTYVFVGPEYLTVSGPIAIMPQLAFLDTSLVAKDKRRYPIDFSLPDIKETVVEVEIPANLAVKYLPASISEETPWLNFSCVYSLKEGRIHFRQTVKLNKNDVAEADYPQFKDFFEGLAKKIKQRVILEKVKAK
ncbi:MAG: DUF3857 domain-containing protein [Candidatus Omnitrophota bacterium]